MADPPPEPDDPVDLASKDSFPASDPPGWIFRQKRPPSKDPANKLVSTEQGSAEDPSANQPRSAAPDDG